ncbi:hypothetical protein EV363DRAFT_1344119 [Boletus edulis]|nr:hypothetical protein EV363DRAFT_1344119 [Boletus edulis]
MIEGRVVLEKIKVLESRIKYQIEKLVRIADALPHPHHPWQFTRKGFPVRTSDCFPLLFVPSHLAGSTSRLQRLKLFSGVQS